jgi:citrate synthase
VTETYATSIGTADATSITVLGRSLADDLMGKISFGELAFWLAALRRPTPGELRMFETVLVALADHGFTPSVIAARLTLTGAPESVQGALAAGLLGGGSRYLGVTEDCGRFLAAAIKAHNGPLPDTDAGWNEMATAAVQAQRTAGKLVPGLGHPLHKDGDPRTPVIFRVAEESGVLGPHLRLFAAVGRVHPAIIGRGLPLNGAGVCGAALADLGFPVDLLRGFALLARTAGLIGHLAEEMRKPAGNDIYLDVDESVEYVAPGTE